MVRKNEISGFSGVVLEWLLKLFIEKIPKLHVVCNENNTFILFEFGMQGVKFIFKFDIFFQP